MSNTRVSSFTQVALLFDELSTALGTEFSSAELMAAAQQLLTLSKSEYVVELHKAVPEKANYYSLEVDFAFSEKKMQIFIFERRSKDYVDHFGYSIEAKEEIRRLVLGCDEKVWEF